MRGQVCNNTGYAGELTIKLNSNNNTVLYRVMNEGHKPLWNAIARVFAGDDVKKYIPKYILVVEQEGSNPVMAGPVPINGAVWGDLVEKSDTSTSVLYKATVTAADKIRSCTDDERLTIQLLNSDSSTDSQRKNVMASITHEDIGKAWNTLKPGVDIILEWKLTFSNKDKEVQM